MSDTNSDVKNVTDRSIDADRIHRAMTESLEIAVVAPQQYAVTHDDHRYDVDLGAGTCECPDATYRDVACKHQIGAATFHAYLEERNPRLVARIVRAVTEHGCAHGVRGCAGPVALGARGIPCEGCLAQTPGHWTVWNRLVEHETVTPDDLPTAPSALVADMDADAGSQDLELMADGGVALADSHQAPTCEHCDAPDPITVPEGHRLREEFERLCPECAGMDICTEDGCEAAFWGLTERAEHIQSEHQSEADRPEGAKQCDGCPGDAAPERRSVPDPRVSRNRAQLVCPRCSGYLGDGRFR